MRLNRTSWHYKVYAWWYHHKRYGEFDSANLCPYVRTVLFYAPLRFFFWWGCPLYTYAALILGIPLATQFLGNLGGAWEIWKLYGMLLTIFAGLSLPALTLALIVHLKDKYEAKYGNIEPDPNTTWNMGKAFVKSLHNKVCPFITFE